MPTKTKRKKNTDSYKAPGKLKGSKYAHPKGQWVGFMYFKPLSKRSTEKCDVAHENRSVSGTHRSASHSVSILGHLPIFLCKVHTKEWKEIYHANCSARGET